MLEENLLAMKFIDSLDIAEDNTFETNKAGRFFNIFFIFCYIHIALERKKKKINK